MIEKNVNVNKKAVTRLVEIDTKGKRVNVLDRRFYNRNGEYYPSVTSILQFMPKNKFFENWLKDVGHNADFIARKAADEGTQVHDAIENYLLGKKITWFDKDGNSQYSMDVWKMILKFVDFWETFTPTLVESEIHLYSDKHKFAGTCDLVLEINNEKWLIDIKTSNSVHTSFDLQTASYAVAWNETFKEKIDHTGILWLKSSKRGEDKKGKKIQGKGWELLESERSIEENFKLFGFIYELYKLENTHSPSHEEIPTEVQIKPSKKK